MTVRIAFYFVFRIHYAITCYYYLKSLKRLIFAKVRYSLILHKLSGGFQFKRFLIEYFNYQASRGAHNYQGL